MLQLQHRSAPVEHEVEAHRAEAMNCLAYRSRAAASPSDAEIQALASAAQSRNKLEGLTGVLIYDRGSFFQWLEGPPDALGRVWARISKDPRHSQIEVLRNEPCCERLFEGWDLRVVTGARGGGVEAAVAALDSRGAMLRRVIGGPPTFSKSSLEELFCSLVVPELIDALPGCGPTFPPHVSTARIWHAEEGSGTKLAMALMSAESHAARRHIDSLLEQGAGFNALYKEVFEPAQVQMGKLLEGDECNGFQLSMGLARLQLEIRRVNAAVPPASASISKHSVLLCPQPRESHYLGVLMSSEVFCRGGWDVDCEVPVDNDALNALVQAHWFDVLQLSQSRSLRRDGQLVSMRATIDAARSASLNPSLIVMVDGRTFAERPQVYRAVHAHAMSLSALNVVSVAERLMAASRSLNASCQVSVS